MPYFMKKIMWKKKWRIKISDTKRMLSLECERIEREMKEWAVDDKGNQMVGCRAKEMSTKTEIVTPKQSRASHKEQEA